jgi:hypothetical protein
MSLLTAKPTLESVDTALKCLAVIVGGLWTYLNYVRGRTFRKRLELTPSGTITDQGGTLFFTGQCVAKNVGLGKIPIQQHGTGVTIYALRLVPNPGGTPHTAEDLVTVLPLFERHGWIEPGEAIADPFFTVLPTPATGQATLLGVRTVILISNGKTVWSASQVTQFQKPKPQKNTQDKEES